MTDEPKEAPKEAQPETEPKDEAKPAQPKADRSNATSNPFGDETRGFDNAFWQGQRFLSPDRSGPSATIGRADIRDMQIGDRTQIFIGQSVSRTLGSIQDEDLAWVRERYLAVPEYEDMLRILTDRRVLLLRGSPGTGRSTTALHLLDRVATARVLRLEGDRALTNPDKSVLPETDSGYVAELSKVDTSGVTVAQLDKLRDVLAGQSSYCVLISDDDPRALDLFGGYAAACTEPDPADLLRKHTFEEILADDPPELEHRLRDLLESGWVAKALGPRPRPMESVRVAIRLVEHARGTMTREEVENDAAKVVRFQISEWFAPLRALQAGAEHDEALNLTAFRVALAVLNESPYHLVTDAARTLGSMLIQASADRETRHASLFSDDRASRLPALRAEIRAGTSAFGHTPIPVELLAFHDERYPQEILRYVWENHHQLAATVVEWLAKLCVDARPLVWVRAAQAVGYLGSFDFAEMFTKVIRPAVRSADDDESTGLWQGPRAAAVALDQAAQHEHVRAAVRERLRMWRRYGSHRERWTAAATYGFVLGSQDIETSFEELRVLGTPSELRPPLAEESVDDGELVVAAGQSIARLFVFGDTDVVLGHLKVWSGGHRASLRALAGSAVRQLANFHGYQLDHLAVSVGRGRSAVPERMKMWPLLLSVHARSPELTEPIAELLHELLRRAGDQVVRTVLGRWFRRSEHHPELLAVLADFLPHIVWDGADERRLVYLVDRLSQDWADPLRPDVADRLRAAILSERVGRSIA